jgi:glycosyltransferase involved in cell wall biosynthesis
MDMLERDRAETPQRPMKFAYVHAVQFPSTEANAFDAVWTASALSHKADTTFFMPALRSPEAALRDFYEIDGAPLQFRSMHLNRMPNRLKMQFKHSYEKMLSAYFGLDLSWAAFRGTRVLYIRHPRHLLYWGLRRTRERAWRDWILCYESHDPLGLNPNNFQGSNPFELQGGPRGSHRQQMLEAAENFDLIICNTRALVEDLRTWSDGRLQPHYIALASPLQRLAAPPRLRLYGEKILLGYVGTIDRYRGVDLLLEAMRFLPQRFALRLVGQFRQEEGIDPNWFDHCLKDPEIAAKVDLRLVDSFKDFSAEVDRCDILVQPASRDVNASRYASPQKSFGYMVRGKTIVAADVPCHRELFQDGQSAALYPLSPQGLADCIIALAEQPERAQALARAAWEQAAAYTYSRRADEILALVRSVGSRPPAQAAAPGSPEATPAP